MAGISRLGKRVLAAVAAALTVTIGAATPSAAAPVKGPLPVPWDLRAGIVPGLVGAEQAPPGANDWHCKPSARHPRPVVLVNPTVTTQALAFQAGSPFLKNQGFCVFTFNFGNVTQIPGFPIQALGDIRQSGRKLAATVDRVLAATGASQVDLVGQSQGAGILPDYYLKFLGGAKKVHTKVGISPSRGTTLSDMVWMRTLIPVIGPFGEQTIRFLTPGLTQQEYDDKLIRQVYGNGDTVPGPQYYAIVTKYDEVVTPYDTQFYDAPNATNWLVQDGCALDHSEHASILYSQRAWWYVLNALDPATASPVPCFYVAPFLPYVR
ncbi:esterase/lipase family protein [Smaragdicoccus niigatensis]|uniref:esterase/lipase family protein n=1 Tax=Smaragdicoccus niigatensis TaxID=359359 RepID=UPI0003737F27|nr:hypothetical protein [Smaragdicoccus niigatensis]